MKAKMMAGLVILALLVGGCKGNKPSPSLSPKHKEKPEYDCLHHAVDNICEVPVNGKVVLYCVKGLKRIVHYREDCE